MISFVFSSLRHRTYQDVGIAILILVVALLLQHRPADDEDVRAMCTRELQHAISRRASERSPPTSLRFPRIRPTSGTPGSRCSECAPCGIPYRGDMQNVLRMGHIDFGSMSRCNVERPIRQSFLKLLADKRMLEGLLSAVWTQRSYSSKSYSEGGLLDSGLLQGDKKCAGMDKYVKPT